MGTVQGATCGVAARVYHQARQSCGVHSSTCSTKHLCPLLHAWCHAPHPQVKIMKEWDPTGRNGPRTPLPDVVKVRAVWCTGSPCACWGAAGSGMAPGWPRVSLYTLTHTLTHTLLCAVAHTSLVVTPPGSRAQGGGDVRRQALHR
jgi:hypothetical protein